MASRALNGSAAGWKRRARRLLLDPLFHFFVVGGVVFSAHRWVAGNPRVVVVTPGVRAELGRSFHDNNGRPPTPAEMDTEVRAWERDEALSREARRQGLDRDDRTIRAVLADHVRARLAQAIPQREPTAEDLDGWLAAHRSQYETPLRYDYQTVAFPKAGAGARQVYERALRRGADARTLGRPLVGGNSTSDELAQRLGPSAAARVQHLPVGQWQELDIDHASDALLVRLNAVSGGLPPVAELRPRLEADWQFAQRQREIDQAIRAIVDGFRFEEGL